MPTFFMKQNDTSPELQTTLKDGDGNAVDVTGSTIVFSMSAAGVVKVNRQSATIVTAASGIVKYTWAAGDTDNYGRHKGEFEVTFGGGQVQTYPNSGAEELIIEIEKEIA